MIESWRQGNNRIAHAAPKETDGGGSTESASEKRIPMKEWLELAKKGEVPESPPDKPKGNKEKSAFNGFMRDLAVSANFGKYKPRSPNEFEEALIVYATGRLRAGAMTARLAAMSELDGRDSEDFNKAVATIEDKLQKLGIVVPEVVANPPDAVAEQPPEEAAATGAIDVDKVFAKLKQMGQSNPQAPKTGGISLDRQDPPAELPKNERRDTAGETDEDIIAQQRTRGLANPGTATGVIDDDVVRDRKARVKTESKEKKQRKSSAKSEKPPAGKTESAEARILAMAQDFDRQATASDDTEFISKLYMQMRDTLPDAEVKVFKKTLRDMGYKVNGDVSHGEAEYIELIPLGRTINELKGAFGEPEGTVDGISFWVLKDGDAVMLGRHKPSDTENTPQRIGQNGLIRVRGNFYVYADGAFKSISEKEVEKRRQDFKDSIEKEIKAGRLNVVEVEEPSGGKETPDTRPERKTTMNQSHERSTRSLREALPVFMRRRSRERASLWEAFADASKGLSVRDRRLLADDVIKGGEPVASVEHVLKRLREEGAQGGGQREARPEEMRVASDIDREVGALMSGQRVPGERRREAPARGTESALRRQIDEELAALFRDK